MDWLALLTTWDLRWEIILVLGTLTGLYSVGWVSLRRRGHQRLASIGRLLSYWFGMAVLFFALQGGIDYYGTFLLFLHVIQHLLLMGVAPVLLCLADPFAVVCWALPARWRKVVLVKLFSNQSIVVNTIRQVLKPQYCLFLFAAGLWIWHDPRLYSLAQAGSIWHDAEHLSFFMPALLVWWHVIGNDPRYHHMPPWLRSLYVWVAGFINAVPGIWIALASTPIYPHYQAMPRIWEYTVMQDQMLAGIIKWIPGTMNYLAAGVILAWRYWDDISKVAPAAAKSLPVEHPNDDMV
jgi:putative membrane protein